VAFAFDRDHPTRPLYSDDDVRLILRSFHTIFGFQNMRMYSGHSVLAHLLGTASCLVKLNRPAVEVATGLLHNIYLQKWHPDLGYNDATMCGRRNALASVVGSEVEQMVWQFIAQSGTGPWESCVEVLNQLYDRNASGRATKTEAADLATVLGAALLPHVTICDELDEAMGGELTLGGNWKRRSAVHYDRVARLAIQIGEPTLAKFVRATQSMNFALHKPRNVSAPLPFRQVSPSNINTLFNTVEYNPETQKNDPGSIDRLQLVSDFGRSDALMTRPYLTAGCTSGMCVEIEKSRVFCDQAINNSDLNTYIAQVIEQVPRVLACEAAGKMKNVAMPLLPPVWTHRGYCGEMCGE
jgi:hypothetical protein